MDDSLFGTRSVPATPDVPRPKVYVRGLANNPGALYDREKERARIVEARLEYERHLIEHGIGSDEAQTIARKTYKSLDE